MTDKRTERSVEAITSGSDKLQQMLRAARIFEELDRQVQHRLPEHARDVIQVACVEGDCLVLAAASPAWSARARLLADELLIEANRHLPKPLTRTRVIVVPSMDGDQQTDP